MNGRGDGTYRVSGAECTLSSSDTMMATEGSNLVPNILQHPKRRIRRVCIDGSTIGSV